MRITDDWTSPNSYIYAAGNVERDVDVERILYRTQARTIAETAGNQHRVQPVHSSSTMSDADMSGFPKPDASVPLKTYKGCCHCQANVFTATYADVTDPKANNIVCDCSHCAKRGIIWAFPERGAVKFEKGGDEKSLTKYKFGAKMYDHYVSRISPISFTVQMGWRWECGAYIVLMTSLDTI